MHPRQSFRFGPFVLRPGERALLRDGVPVPILPKTFDLLLALVESHGELLSKHDLLQRVWPGVFVQDNNLTVHISALRKILGDDANGSAFIETVPKAGYRFVAPVDSDGAPPLPTVAHTPDGARSRVWTAAIIATVVLIAASLFAWKELRHERAAREIHSLLVLPLQNLSGDTAQDYLAQALTDSLTTDLAQLRDLRVISRTTALRYMQAKASVPQIARETKVDAVIEGSITRAGDTVRVNVQLIDSSDRHVWAAAYEDRNADVLHLERAMAENIADEIAANLTARERDTMARRFPTNPAAYREYLLARFFWNQREEKALQKSIEHFQAAISADPKFALAYAGLADAYGVQPEFSSVSPLEAAPQAKVAALKALELDPDLGEAHCALAYVLWGFDWNYAAAEQEFRRGIALAPNYATGHQWYGQFLLSMRRFDEGDREIRTALELDPFSKIINLVSIYPPLYRHDYDEAERRAARQQELFPDFALGDLGEILFLKRKEGHQPGHLEKLNSGGGQPQAWITLAATGSDQRARRGIASGLGAADEWNDLRTLYKLAQAYAMSGKTEPAVRALDRLDDARFPWLVYLNCEPSFDNLRRDPHFQQIVRHLNQVPWVPGPAPASSD